MNQTIREVLQSRTRREIPQIPLIAEIGINHNGDLNLAKQMIQMSSQLGVACVKFQKRTVNMVYSHEVLAQPRESPWGKTQADQKYGLEFDKEEYDEIDAWCRSLDIPWTASAWDIPSLDFIDGYNPPFHKIASAMCTNIEFIETVAKKRKFAVISTGMMTWEEVDRVVNIFRNEDTQFMLMHTVSVYPTPEEDLNLSLIPALSDRYGVPVGYSGHESSVSPSLAAASMGAICIERHITLDRTMYGSDQPASLGENGLRELVGQLNRLPHWIGIPEKHVSVAEEGVAIKLRYWENKND